MGWAARVIKSRYCSMCGVRHDMSAKELMDHTAGRGVVGAPKRKRRGKLAKILGMR